MLSLTQIGPSTGAVSLGNGVTTSALTSVGTLTSLSVSGNASITGTGYLQLPAGTDAQQPGQSGQAAAVEGMLRYNTDSDVFEGYDGNTWGKIGGGAAVQSAAPGSANNGDLWYDTDDGRMFVYYDEGTGGSAQWVDASPNGVPTDLVVDGTTTLKGQVNIVGDATKLNFDSGAASGTFEFYREQSGNAYVKATNQLRIQVGNTIMFANSANGVNSILHLEETKIKAFKKIIPDADATIDLGSATKRWANIYSADLQLSNEGAANDVDGTWGQYTIQEGEEDLFLINRRSGKKYKFMLQEVN